MVDVCATDSNISTHTPHARRDDMNDIAPDGINSFQLTRLMRGVTMKIVPFYCHMKFQLTRLMRGVTTFFKATPHIS